MNTTKVKILADFTMGSLSLKTGEERIVEDWRAQRLSSEGLVEIVLDKKIDTPSVDKVQDPAPSKKKEVKEVKEIQKGKKKK